MAKNHNQTSNRVASLASATLNNANASATAKGLAASALAQRSTGKQTGAQVENLASRALNSGTSAATTKELAGSVLSQSNKQR